MAKAMISRRSAENRLKGLRDFTRELANILDCAERANRRPIQTRLKGGIARRSRKKWVGADTWTGDFDSENVTAGGDGAEHAAGFEGRTAE